MKRILLLLSVLTLIPRLTAQVTTGQPAQQATGQKSEPHQVVSLGSSIPARRVSPTPTTQTANAKSSLGDVGVSASQSLMGFDTLSCLDYVDAYYNGGFSGAGTGIGPNYGVTFSPNSLVLNDFGLNPCNGSDSRVTNEPSPLNSLIFLDGSAATMNVPAGFTGGLSFYYSALMDGFINIWSGLNATGVLITTLNLPALTECNDDPYYCVWAPIGVSFAGTAKSVDFGGSANFIAFDSISLGSQTATNPQKSSGGPGRPGSCQCGNPIDIGSGNKYQQVEDYSTQGANKLALQRYYNSLGNTGSLATSLGTKWRTNYDRYLRIVSANTVTAERADGQEVNFSLNGGKWASDSDVDLVLTQTTASWTLKDSNDSTEVYNTISPSEAVLQSITTRNGYVQQLLRNTDQSLATVIDSYMRTIKFTYSSGFLMTAATPDNLVVSFGYTLQASQLLLNTVSYSTAPATTVTYIYDNPSLPTFLTGVTDENGKRFATWTYDNAGRALTSQHGDGAELTTVTYNDTDSSRTVTNALGVTDTYSFLIMQGVPKVTKISRAATTTTGAAIQTFTYDSNGYVSGKTDWNNTATIYTNDAHGQPLTVTEASGTPVARSTTIVYDPVWVHLPSTVTTPGLTTSFKYDPAGNLHTKTLSDTTATTIPYPTTGTTRTWTYGWTNYLLTSIIGPRTDLSAMTMLGYDSTGTLTSITNALGHPTNITLHTTGGRPLTIVDSNQVTTQLAYDGRQRLISSTLMAVDGPLKTSYGFDLAGNLTSTTQPDGSTLTNVYDQAHRLTKVTDSLGNYTNYTLDALDDRTQQTIYKKDGTTKWQHSATFDALGRVLVDTSGAGQTTTQTYDLNGNTVSVVDGRGNKTTNTYDALNRFSGTTDANGGVTKPAFDAHDRIISVADANSNATLYARDGFGDVIQQISPDSGTSIFLYDADGNVTSKTDAMNIVTSQTFDAMDRPQKRTYPASPAENVAFSYDQTGTGFILGTDRLTSVMDQAGSLIRQYDERGNVINEKRVGSGTTLNTSSTYDSANRLASLTYPDGTLVTYQHDAAGYLSNATAKLPGASTATQIATFTHQPFGPLGTVTYGNGITETWTFDQSYRPSNISDVLSGASLQNLTYGYDLANNATSISDSVNTANSETLGYDPLDRLTSAVSGGGGYGTFGWTYDPVGNRLTQQRNGATTSYTYTPGSNRLATISPVPAISTLKITPALSDPNELVGPSLAVTALPMTILTAMPTGPPDTVATILPPAPLQVAEQQPLQAPGLIQKAEIYSPRRNTEGSHASFRSAAYVVSSSRGVTRSLTAYSLNAFNPSGLAILITPAAPLLPPSGIYTAPFLLSIPIAPNTRIFYTEDGTAPTANSYPYSNPFWVGSSLLIRAIAVSTLQGGGTSSIASAQFLFPPPVTATPVFSLPGGAYSAYQTVTLSEPTPGATIYYTVDGSTPTTSSPQYIGPLQIRVSETLNAVAVAQGYSVSSQASATYTLPAMAAPPAFSIPGGVFTSQQLLSIGDATPGYSVYLTTDGTVPTTSSKRYIVPIPIATSETVQAIATAPGYLTSTVVSAVFTIRPVPPPPVVSRPPPVAPPVTAPPPVVPPPPTVGVTPPTFSPGSGTFTSPQTVTITDSNSQAIFYYTLDGSTPIASSLKYSGPLTVQNNETIQAIAVVGPIVSSVTSATYSIIPASIATVQTNANGNITSIPPANSTASATFSYNNANRLQSVAGSPIAASFIYDWAGQRFSKTDGGTPPTIYSYARGTIIAENDGGTVTDYIYADGRPIAQIQPSAAPSANQISYVIADRLGTPQRLTNGSGSAVWSTTYQPFGTTGAMIATTNQNLRLPGQLADAETGFSYNINRDYMPNLGRFVEADPIGIAGGEATYSYALNSPTGFIDVDGLDVFVGQHGAFGSSADPFDHTTIILRPNDPKAFANNPLFGSSGGKQATLGAQMGGANVSSTFGALESRPNFPGDDPSKLTDQTQVPLPSGMTDSQFISSLILAAQSYNNNLTYQPFPSLFSETYNSNSFVAGVIDAAGGIPPTLPWVTPGYGKPIPLHIPKPCFYASPNDMRIALP